MGHTTIRGNDGSYAPLRADDVTVAAVLKKAGYHTALAGKWGLGDHGTTGYPLSQGFDEFVGQDSQVGCHNWYPYIIQNGSNSAQTIPANKDASFRSCGEHLQNCVWSNDLFLSSSLEYIRRRAKEPQPFFLYFSTTTPHEGYMGVSWLSPKYPVPWPFMGKYQNHSHSGHSEKGSENWNFSAAVWAEDIFVGKILDELDAQHLSENTVVFFSGDNGPANDRDFAFDDANGPFRGYKSSVHEGGIRQQVLVRWPSHIEAGSVSDHWFTFWDFLPTAADLANASLPAGIDGTSAVPSLEGKQQENLTPVYYEFCCTKAGKTWAYGGGWAQAYRKNDWKAIRLNEDTSKMVLYNLSADVGEQHDIAKENPQVVKELAELMDKEHTDDHFWPKGKQCCGNCFQRGGCGKQCPGGSDAGVFVV